MVWQVSALLACFPRKVWDFRLSEMVSDALFATKAPTNCNKMMTGGRYAQSFSGRENLGENTEHQFVAQSRYCLTQI